MSVYVIRMSANNFTRVILNTLLYRVKLGFPLNVVFAFRQICEVQSLLEHSSPRIFYNQCFSSFSLEKLFLSLLSRCLHFEFRDKKTQRFHGNLGFPGKLQVRFFLWQSRFDQISAQNRVCKLMVGPAASFDETLSKTEAIIR